MLPRFLIDFSYPETDYVICTDEEFGFIAEACLTDSPIQETESNINATDLNAFFRIIKKPLTIKNEEQFDYIVALGIKFYEEQAKKHYTHIDCQN